MNIKDKFASNFFRAEDVEGTINLTIKACSEQAIGDDDRVVLSFKESPKQLPLNKTNALVLADAFGAETDEWKGRMIELNREMVMFKGERVPAVRVKAASSKAQKNAAGPRL